MSKKIIATNRKAKFEFFLLEHFEAGLVLKGSEIKSIRARQASITEAFVQTDGNEVWLVDAHIAPYDPASRENHDPKRKRKLLLKKKEINEIWQSIRQKGLTAIPTSLYLKDGLAKIEVAVAKGKKLYDKRRDIAKRDMQRDLEREGHRR
ncbi:MAG TPA: SsrA-binding protein SmpB [Pelolinea sp.]|nr:SsrA-binding protein SmpB [Pelolinea sp.]